MRTIAPDQDSPQGDVSTDTMPLPSLVVIGGIESDAGFKLLLLIEDQELDVSADFPHWVRAAEELVHQANEVGLPQLVDRSEIAGERLDDGEMFMAKADLRRQPRFGRWR